MRRASREGDSHTCPSHVGGPISSGWPSVKIEGLSAARASDSARCSGATDLVASGAGTVLIGRMPAARIDEACHHGGAIVGGATTVLIGGPSVEAAGLAQLAENVGEAVSGDGSWSAKGGESSRTST
jgi:uncharacterized Zn-binding protein involved in type VI secretion